MLFARVLRSFVTVGVLHIVDASGRVHVLKGLEPGPEATMRIHSRRTQWRLLWRPALALGEAYMDGTLTVEGGDLYPLIPPTDDIHYVKTISKSSSISIHLLANDTACVWRHKFDPGSGVVTPFRSGYANAPCPSESASA